MNDFVNWDFLEQTLGCFQKKAKSEILNPADRSYLDQPENAPNQQENSDSLSTSPERDSNMRNKTPLEEESDTESVIEVQNIKGKIKKIDPSDYQVMIMASNEILFSGSINRIASGMYSDIIKSHGTKEALRCIVTDYAKNPHIFTDGLNLTQAKLTISSLTASIGYLPKKSFLEIKNKLTHTANEELNSWIKTRSFTIK